MYGPLKFYTQEIAKTISDRAKEALSYLYPAITMYEEGGDLYIDADLPGFDKKEIKVRQESNAVIISASRMIDPKGSVIFNQRPESVYKRIRLPFDVEPESEVVARYQNGILSLKIPSKGLKTVKIE
ncbi:MAG: Hsp20/alpha crystallin family protein [Candidatus Thermoplasmatota archaeon]|jgi:HSP20 family molecular chaperone IbpA|nr:Hsp20/alpha crystallin family protein [Candidatus Thermoplasmatota archaeon]MCL5785974.1 Hsp20/alpha crystallin family protein [Candidatus Thermoplasmatota archaeon]